MAYEQVILGESVDKDYVFENLYESVQYHEDGKYHKLENNCMIVTACDKAETFEKEFLEGTGLVTDDFEMHYIYHAEYIYIPKDQDAFESALSRILENTRRSTWCPSVIFHIKALYRSSIQLSNAK